MIVGQVTTQAIVDSINEQTQDWADFSFSVGFGLLGLLMLAALARFLVMGR